MTSPTYLPALINRRGRLADQLARGRSEMEAAIRGTLRKPGTPIGSLPEDPVELTDTAYGAEILEAVRFWCQCDWMLRVLDHDTAHDVADTYRRLREDVFPAIQEAMVRAELDALANTPPPMGEEAA